MLRLRKLAIRPRKTRLVCATANSSPKEIEELQARNEKKAEMAAMSWDELVEILTDIVHATVPG
jgi:hypothetical protein